MDKEESEPIGLHRGWIKRFRLPTDEELIRMESDALDMKQADEDYDIYT
ncbi:hypothetical protein [Synergistes jonesii]|nr:hypothetical protein [Synergistes jonesii]